MYIGADALYDPSDLRRRPYRFPVRERNGSDRPLDDDRVTRSVTGCAHCGRHASRPSGLTRRRGGARGRAAARPPGLEPHRSRGPSCAGSGAFTSHAPATILGPCRSPTS